MKKNKGITLIALVITIIVLLILAGVAISMLSGENGILRKATEAKTKTEEAQEDEETALIDMELNAHFIEKNFKYKCAYGYITGLKEGEDASILQAALPSNYEVKAEDGTDNFTVVATGLAIVKDGKTVARTVLFGDINCDGSISSADITRCLRFISGLDQWQNYQIVAMDINHDGYVGNIDSNLIARKTGNLVNLNDYQRGTATNFKKISKKSEIETTKEYISKLEMKDTSYKWVEKSTYMRLEGAITAETTGNVVIEGLGLTGKAYVRRTDSEEGTEETITTQGVKIGDEIVLIDGYEAYGNRIEVLGKIYYEK